MCMRVVSRKDHLPRRTGSRARKLTGSARCSRPAAVVTAWLLAGAAEGASRPLCVTTAALTRSRRRFRDLSFSALFALWSPPAPALCAHHDAAAAHVTGGGELASGGGGAWSERGIPSHGLVDGPRALESCRDLETG
jgi:hypothetical protein